MGYRRFIDRDGRAWEVRDRSRSEWRLVPVSGNPLPPVDVPAPGYETDPFELSNEELQRLVNGMEGRAGRPRTKKSPFLDD